MTTTLTMYDIKEELAGLFLTTPPPPPLPLPLLALDPVPEYLSMILTDVTVRVISVHTHGLAQVIYMVILIPIITKVTKITRGFDNPDPQSILRLQAKLVQGLADTSQTSNCILTTILDLPKNLSSALFSRHRVVRARDWDTVSWLFLELKITLK